jgi:hypothetical protein
MAGGDDNPWRALAMRQGYVRGGVRHHTWPWLRSGAAAALASISDLVSGCSYCPSFVRDEMMARARLVDRLNFTDGASLDVVWPSARPSTEGVQLRDRFAACMLDTVSLLRAATPSASHPPGMLQVVFMPSARTRSLPCARYAPLMPDNVNGGVTFRRVPVQVLVFRAEDACKVLVHELLHAFGWGDAFQSVSAEAVFAARWRVRSTVPGGVMGLHEVFVETLACYLHTLWSAGHAALPRVRRHVLRVAQRLLVHHGRLRPQDASRVMREGTHSFAYGIGKAAFWGRQTTLDAFLRAYPPGRRVSDARGFAGRLDAALQAWPEPRPTDASRSRSMRLTCLA